MSWDWLWRRWCHRVQVDTEQAQAALDKLSGQDAEITRLGRRLRAAQRRNNFSPMVAEALRRVRES